MTLAATPIVNSYTGTGAVNSYPFNFVAFSSSDIAVTVLSPTGTTYVLTLGTDYTVSGLNAAGAPATTGSITLVNSGQAWLTSGFLTSGWTITLTRTVTLEQATSIRNQGDFYPETHEDTFDYLMMAIQQLDQAITAPVIPNGFTTTAGDLTFSTAGTGPVLVDPITGKQYRVLVYNGTLSLQEVT